jgi:cytochrome P450
LGFLSQNQDLYDYNKSSTEFFPIMELGTNVPFIHSILSSRLMQAMAGPKPEDKVGMGAIIGVLQKIVADRFSGQNLDEKRDRDMLDAFMGRGLTQLEAESESLLQILAGSDSTATSIRMTFAYLLTNPPCYAKLQKEIDNAVEAGGLSYPVVADSQAQKLPYLQACIKEGLRMWQPLNGTQTKVLAQTEGVTVDNVWIPGGTQVALSQHQMMRRQDLFGPDADSFRPERWFSDTETLRGYEKVWDLSFAAGRFTCLGKNIALMELNKVFIEVGNMMKMFSDLLIFWKLLRRFDFGLANPVQTMKTKCHQLHVQRDFFVRAWARS